MFPRAGRPLRSSCASFPALGPLHAVLAAAGDHFAHHAQSAWAAEPSLCMAGQSEAARFIKAELWLNSVV